ncbi:MAG: spore cortex biosynthesis protein YabQ [Limnochordia bacterium]|jgi:spore cortex biosynthesis protein YabQ
MESLTTQMTSFLIVIFAGLLLGCLFDIYRVFRGLLRPGALLTPILDLLFWAVATPAVFLLLLTSNWGELRFYVFLGMGLGLFLYGTVLTHFVLRFCITFVEGANVLLGGLAQIFLLIIGFPFFLLRETIVFIGDTPLVRGFSRRAPWGRPRWRWPPWRKW